MRVKAFVFSSVVRAVPGLIAMALAAPALAGAPDVFSRQRNGLWETKRAGSGQPAQLFCVTDEVKMNAREQTERALKQLGCTLQKESASGEQFELQWSCASSLPQVGSFHMTSKGTLGSDRGHVEHVVTGGGPLMQAVSAGLNGRYEWRWLRACRPGEKPGLQN
jgi:hypothetical protein